MIQKLKTVATLLIPFVMPFGIIGSSQIQSITAPMGQSVTQIELTDWKIAPTGTVTGVDGKEYLLTPGLPDIVTDYQALNPDNDLADWINAPCPGTVAGALISSGKYDNLFKSNTYGNKDVYFDDNMSAIPFTDFAEPWWWRTNVNIPATEMGKKVILTFKGINYVAEIYVNGKKLSNKNINIKNNDELLDRTGVDPSNYEFSIPTTMRKNFLSAISKWEEDDGLEKYKDLFLGVFRTYDLDITEYINDFDAMNGSKNNIIAVKNTRPYYQPMSGRTSLRPLTGDLALFYVDWHSTPPDHNMGLIGKAYISTHGGVYLANPAVGAKVAENLSVASLSFYVEATNTTNADITGTLIATIKDSQGKQVGKSLSVNCITVPANAYNHEIAVPATVIDQPDLWWPYGMGSAPLYTVDYEFKVGQNPYGMLRHRFGIREITNEVNYFTVGANTSLQNQIYVNHRPVLIKSGGYCPTDSYLRQNKKTDQAVIDYLKYMGMNALRDEGKFWNDNILDLMDENGILFLAGWCCCDRWQNPEYWTLAERFIAFESIYGIMRNLRSHSSMIMWFNGSDRAPDNRATNIGGINVARRYLEIIGKLNWNELGISVSNATRSGGVITGELTGLHMSNGYDCDTPTLYYSGLYTSSENTVTGTYGFVSEGHGGPGIPVIETMRKMIPEANLWPHNIGKNYNVWSYHAARRTFPNIDQFATFVDNTYGGSNSIEEWLMRAQLYVYDGQRAQYESLNLHRYVTATGHVNWMTTSTRPSFFWNQFDFYMNPHGATFGAAKANEPVHIMYDYLNKDIYVINNTLENKGSLTAKGTIYDINGNIIGKIADKSVIVLADGIYGKTGRDEIVPKTIGFKPDSKNKTTDKTTYTQVTTNFYQRITGSTGISKIWTMDDIDSSLTRPTTDVYFLRLELWDGNTVVSRNDYAIPRRQDVAGAYLSWSKNMPFQTHDMTQLNQLPKVDIKAVRIGKTNVGKIITQTFNISNNSDAIAYAVEMKAYKDKEHTDLINPIIFEDNLFTLYPGESRKIDVSYRSEYFNSNAEISITCYNNVISNKSERFSNIYTPANPLEQTATSTSDNSSSTNLARGRQGYLVEASGTTSPDNNVVTNFTNNAVNYANSGNTVLETYLNGNATITINGKYYIDFGTAKTFDRLMLRWNGMTTSEAQNTIGQRPEHVQVDISDDGFAWTTIITDFDNSKAASVMNNIVLDKPYTAQYVRITPSEPRTAAPAVGVVTNAYPDYNYTTAPGWNDVWRNPVESGKDTIAAATNFLLTSFEVYQSYSHLIQVDFAGIGNAVTVTANAKDGHGMEPKVISSSVTDKYSRMRMIPNTGIPVEFVINPKSDGNKILVLLNGVNITNALTANLDGTYSFFSDKTDDFAVLTIYGSAH